MIRVTVLPATGWVSEYEGPWPLEALLEQWQEALPHLRKRATREPGRISPIWESCDFNCSRCAIRAFKSEEVGISHLTVSHAVRNRAETSLRRSVLDYVTLRSCAPNKQTSQSLSQIVFCKRQGDSYVVRKRYPDGPA